jgi:hypothetical protein
MTCQPIPILIPSAKIVQLPCSNSIRTFLYQEKLTTMKTTILTLLSLGLLSVTEAAVFPSKGAVNELTSKTWKNKLNDGVSPFQAYHLTKLVLIIIFCTEPSGKTLIGA